MLCEECVRVFSRGDRNHHSSLASLTKAVTAGCYICTPLWESVRPETGHLEDDLESHFIIGRILDSSSRVSRSLPEEHIISCSSLFTRGRKKSVAHSFPKRLDSRSFVAVPTANVPVNVGTYGRWSTIPMAESLQAAQKWMSTCLDTHEQCQKHKQPHTYPTRLLELGSHKVSLILPHEEELSGPYAALSYCWGPKPSFIRLTADNMQDFRLGILCSDLPIAFQEAIRFVEGLGIRYVWIDALCIIQSGRGSSEDWQLECSRMQEVYSNCIINISLVQAAHPDQSCMGGYTRKANLPFTTNVAMRRMGGDFTGTAPAFTVIPSQYFRHSLYQQPLGSRAWVLQERLLATRVLSIGHGELFWDCERVLNASESLPCGFELCSDPTRAVLSEALGLQISSIPQASDSWTSKDTWSKLLMEYSARQLTYPQADKLIAISAIASCMRYASNDTYLAGHFWKTLPQSLNWRANRAPGDPFRADERPPHRLPKSSSQMLDGNWVVTPTWSWASMNGRLRTRPFVGVSSTVIAIAEEYRLSPLGKNERTPFMEKMILLTIRAWSRPITWMLGGPIGYKNTESLKEEGFERLYVTMDEPDEKPENGSMFLLAALVEADNIVEGLLLREINMYEDRVYERLGQFRAPFDCDIGTEWQSLFTDGERSITMC